ncbi:MAG: PEP-CTERM sorting domain-containing protein [Cyanobacteriota bacterium]|nr:PEP-CTERM sorting domain-containing protein [Cyanobacteriota bacterium]
MRTNKRQSGTISVHQTLQGQLKVNWKREYKNEFLCPQCNEARIKFYTHQKTLCRVSWYCSACQFKGSLTQKVPAYIFRYRSDLECPNPNCQEIGNDAQKGWIYQMGEKRKLFTCRFCGVGFIPNSSHPCSWHSRQNQEKLSAFKFDEDIWDLRHFYENTTNRKKLNFHEIKPDWYKFQVKKYIQFQINSQSSAESIIHFLSYFRQFGAIIQQKSISTGEDTAVWSLGAIVQNLALSKEVEGGSYSILDPFGEDLVSSLIFTAPDVPGIDAPRDSDYALVGIAKADEDDEIIPEPATLLGLGVVGGLMAVSRRKKSSR